MLTCLLSRMQLTRLTETERGVFVASNQPISLYEAKKYGTFHLACVPQIGLLEGMGLRIGTKVTVQNRYAFGGPVLLRVEDAYCIALGKDIAQQITVRENTVS